jgi:hypothetical protein
MTGIVKVNASMADRSRFLILDPSGLHLENTEEKYIDFKDPFFNNDEYVGDMKVYKLDDYDDGRLEDDTGLTELIVPKSKGFTFSRTDGTIMDLFFVEKFIDSKHKKYVNTNLASKVFFSDDELMVSTQGDETTCDYSFGGYMSSLKRVLCVTGITTGMVALKDTKQGINLIGANGKVCFDLTDKKNKNIILTKYYYIYNNQVTVKVKGDKLYVSPAVFISNKKKNKIQNLYLRPTNSGKNMFLSWDRVRKAKSYVVYKYDNNAKKYKKVTVRNGYTTNFYNIPNAVSGEVYRYKVAGKTKKNGKGKIIVKKSYPVWAVAKPATLGNATKVTTSKTKLTGKVGKTKKLKAKITAAGVPKLSTYIRWYSSNAKIAKVDRKTGKVKFRKKGKCYIWAKAHNGKNSKKILVKVK